MATTEVRQGESQVAQHILRVAARLFAERGYDATPVRVIAEEAGVTKPTLYYHFGSKEGLAHALLTVPMARLMESLRELSAKDEDAEVLLGEYLEAHFAFCREEPDRVRFIYALFFGPLGAGLKREVESHACGFETMLDAIVGRALEGGKIRSEDARRFRTALHGLISIYTMDYLYKGVNLDEGLGHQLVKDLLGGFGWNQGTPRPAGEDSR